MLENSNKFGFKVKICQNLVFQVYICQFLGKKKKRIALSMS